MLTLAAVSQRVDSAKATRIVDASHRRFPLQKKIGAGMTPEEFRAQVAAGVIKHHGLPESIAMVADGLGLAVDEITETIEPVIAEVSLRDGISGSSGGTGGGRASNRAWHRGRQRKNLHGIENVRGREKLRGYDRTRRRAEALTLTIPGGTHGDIATAAIVVNAIPIILAAPAGLRTSRDLPLTFLAGNAEPRICRAWVVRRICFALGLRFRS